MKTWLAALVFVAAALPARAGKPDAPGAADPEATKLLSDARAARANWHDFPGFTADAEVNLDGKVTRGRAVVKADGAVDLEVEKSEAAAWARRSLASTV